jgi:hypothetical protein
MIRRGCPTPDFQGLTGSVPVPAFCKGNQRSDWCLSFLDFKIIWATEEVASCPAIRVQPAWEQVKSLCIIGLVPVTRS